MFKVPLNNFIWDTFTQRPKDKYTSSASSHVSIKSNQSNGHIVNFEDILVFPECVFEEDRRPRTKRKRDRDATLRQSGFKRLMIPLNISRYIRIWQSLMNLRRALPKVSSSESYRKAPEMPRSVENEHRSVSSVSSSESVEEAPSVSRISCTSDDSKSDGMNFKEAMSFFRQMTNPQQETSAVRRSVSTNRSLMNLRRALPKVSSSESYRKAPEMPRRSRKRPASPGSTSDWSNEHHHTHKNSRSSDQSLDSEDDLDDDITLCDSYSGQFSDHWGKSRGGASPVPVCVSPVRNAQSSGPLSLKDGRPSADQMNKLKRGAAPVPSCVSMRSDQSKDPPLTFKDGRPLTNASHPRAAWQKWRRGASPARSCLSMRSDQSKEQPLTFKDRCSFMKQRRHFKRGDAPVRRCVSMKSDESKNPPLAFQDGRHSDDQMEQTFCNDTNWKFSFKNNQDRSEDLSDKPALLDHQHLDTVFTLLEKNIVTFVKNQLKVAGSAEDAAGGQSLQEISNE
ncbi:hypothetical protein Q5P01_000334 [Channa striata]|uniref:Uncharacterized protein n=1 Tax=Channa striata TaxID=64152 RepID=A0AA88LF76_CHASR|nr:hypothetical protein Q5P01_000334 [Channa striata]